MEAAELLRQMLDASGEWVLAIDRTTGVLMECTQSVCRQTGRARGELVGQRLIDLRIGFAIQTGDDWSDLLHRLERDGEAAIDQFQFSLGSDGCILVRQRVPDQYRERVEDMLRASRERYRNFMEMSAELIWRVDFDEPIDTGLPEDVQAAAILKTGYVADCNDAMAAFLGMERGVQMIGSRLSTVLAPLDHNRHSEMLSVVRNGYRVVNYETTYMVRGVERRLLRNVQGILEHGKLVRVWGASRDITALRETDEMLRKGEQRYHAFIANSSEGIFRLEYPEAIPINLPPEEIIRRSWDTGRIAECNIALAKMRGYDHPDELKTLSPMEFRLATEEEWQQGLAFIANGFRFSGVERPTHTRDGSQRWFRYSAIGVVEDGMLARVWGTVSDVTDRKNLERELRALSARQSDVLEQERTRIAREIHDELGQQLTALKFETAAVESGKRKPAKGEMTQLIDAAIHSVRRIATDLRPAILDHFGLGAAVEWQSNEFARHAGIACNCHVEKGLEVAPRLSTTTFRILQEALTNAARHAGASLIRVSLVQIDGQLELVVEDNGRGMAQRNSPARPSLGLIGMRERALDAGGTLEVISSPGAGTRVHARFPLAPATPSPAERPE